MLAYRLVRDSYVFWVNLSELVIIITLDGWRNKKGKTLFPRVSSFLCELSVGPADLGHYLCHYYKIHQAWSADWAFCRYCWSHKQPAWMQKYSIFIMRQTVFQLSSSGSPHPLHPHRFEGAEQAWIALFMLFMYRKCKSLKLLLPISEVSEYWLIRMSTPTRVGRSQLYHPQGKKRAIWLANYWVGTQCWLYSICVCVPWTTLVCMLLPCRQAFAHQGNGRELCTSQLLMHMQTSLVCFATGICLISASCWAHMVKVISAH